MRPAGRSGVQGDIGPAPRKRGKQDPDYWLEQPRRPPGRKLEDERGEPMTVAYEELKSAAWYGVTTAGRGRKGAVPARPTGRKAKGYRPAGPIRDAACFQ